MNIGDEKIRKEIERYCAIQDRSVRDIESKLIKLGVNRNDTEPWLVYLKKNRFLDEERFARNLAHGKLVSNRWGKIKIRQALRQHGISDYIITVTLDELDRDEYFETALKRASLKMPELRRRFSRDNYAMRSHLSNHMAQAGFENFMLEELWNRLQEE